MEAVPVTVSAGVADPEIATVLYFPAVMSPVVSAIVTLESFTSFPVVPLNRTAAFAVEDAGPTTSPEPDAVDVMVIVSVAAFVVSVIPEPATSVSVSEVVSATTSLWPLIAIVLNRF